MERVREGLAAANADHRLTDDEIDRALDPKVPLLVERGTAATTIVVTDARCPASCATFTAYGDGRVTDRVALCPPRGTVTIRSGTETRRPPRG